jgi:hypothetical protein
MEAYWMPPDNGEPVTLATDARGPTERMFESWVPGSFSQVIQDDPLVDSQRRFVNPLGNWAIGGRLRVWWAFASQADMALAMHQLPSQMAGVGTLQIDYPGFTVSFTSAAVATITPFEVMEVRVGLEFEFKAEAIDLTDN